MNDQRKDQPALRLINGGVVYPNGARALHPASLDFATGAFTVLLGPSGAGKSTLLRSLNGLVPLTEGHIETARHGVLRSSRLWREHRRETGMVFQQHQLIGRLSAFANVLTGRLGHHGALRSMLPLPEGEKRLALEALERVGLIDFALRRADQLSGGQQQRVGIARALAQRPGLILADEPVASLDPATAVRVLALLHDICRQDRLAAIVSLHQVELARQFADRIVGIGAGRVVFDGPPDALDNDAVRRIYGGAPSTPSASLTVATPALETTP